MTDYSGMGNERLYPIAIDRADGDQAEAVAELERRGNTVTQEGKLRKVRRTRMRSEDGRERTHEVVVENGKIVEDRGPVD